MPPIEEPPTDTLIIKAASEDMGKELSHVETTPVQAAPRSSTAAFKPGWLKRTIDEARISCLANHGPSFWRDTPAGVGLKAPVSAEDAAALFDKMNARYLAWTCRTLADVVEERGSACLQNEPCNTVPQS